MNIQIALFLLVSFQIKHFLADFCFQSSYMLEKQRPGWDFVAPLATHCVVHSIGTLIILTGFQALHLWPLCIFDFVAHFLMDRIKASPKLLGRYNDPAKGSYWRCLGFDQLIHHFTHYIIIYIILAYS